MCSLLDYGILLMTMALLVPWVTISSLSSIQSRIQNIVYYLSWSFFAKNKFKIKLLIIVVLSFWREHLQILSKKQSYHFMLVIKSYVCHSPVIKNSLGNIFEREGSQRSDKKLYELDAFMFTSLVTMIYFDLFITYFKETESSQKVIFS